MDSFRIENIKSFVDSGEIAIKPITIFVGQNSCGKSSLIRFPVVLSQTMKTRSSSSLNFYGEYIDYGNYEEIIHKETVAKQTYDESPKIKFSITQKFNTHGEKQLKGDDLDVVTLSVVLDNIEHRNIIDRIDIWVNGDQLGVIECVGLSYNDDTRYGKDIDVKDEDTQYQLRVVDGYIIRVEMDHFLPLVSPHLITATYKKSQEDLVHRLNTEDYFWEDGKWRTKNSYFEALPSAEELAEARDRTLYVAAVIEKFNNICRRSLEAVSYVEPFRENPERIYRDPEYKVISVGTRGQYLSDFLISQYRDDRRKIKEISSALKKVLGYELKLKELGNSIFQIRVIDENGRDSNVKDTGYGLSMLLPIIAQCLGGLSDTTKFVGGYKIKNTVIIEQPELHLHPAAQARLGEFFGTCIFNKYNEIDKNIIIETHSEHLIRKLQILVANQTLSKEMVGIYYVDKNQNGDAFIKEMALGDDGRFDEEWPTGFFDEGYNLTMELLRASAK